MNRQYEAPEDFVNGCMAQLEQEIAQLRTALLCIFSILFSIGFVFLI